MASTRYYLDYLNDQIDISPANSQEELDAAQLLQSLMDEHGLDTTMQEFDAPAGGEFTHDLTYVLLFFGMATSGVLDSTVGVVGRVIVLVCVALLALRFGGYDLLGGIGPKARSQNVIGVHRATGPLVVKGNRPIVIVAHYDSPNENPLYRRNFVSLLPVIKRMSLWLVILISLCTLLQLIGVIPEVGRHVFWGIGIVAGIPLLAIGVADIYERFAPCTVGASDNKSSVAALLGVMDMVRPADDDAKRQAAERLRGELEQDAAADQAPQDEVDDSGDLNEGAQVGEAHIAPGDVDSTDDEDVGDGEGEGSATKGSSAVQGTSKEGPDTDVLPHESSESSDRDEDSLDLDQDPRTGLQDGDVGGVGQARQGDDQGGSHDQADGEHGAVEHVGERVAPLGPSDDHELLSADGPAYGVLDALGGAVPGGAHPHHGVGGGSAGQALGGVGGDDGARKVTPHPGGQGGAAGRSGEGDRGAVGDAVDRADDEGAVVEVL